MIARIITYSGAQYGLLAAQPNWDTEIKVTLELPTDVSKEPITLQESRRNFAQSARYKMEWTSYLSNAADTTELRIFLTRIRETPVIVPLWPDACELATDIVAGRSLFTLVDLPARFGALWIIANDDFSVRDIVTVASLNLDTKAVRLAVGALHAYSKGSRMYPLLFGRLDEQPKPEAITDESADVAFKVKETSAFAYRLTPASKPLPIVGSHIPAFATIPLWNTPPNHSRPLDWTEMPDIVYEQVGFLRQEQQRAYDHRTPRGLELEFYQNERASIAKMEYFWRDRRATTLRFMIPTYRGDLRMLFDTPTVDHPTLIACERSFFSNPGREPQPGDPFIALIKSNDSVTPYQLSSALDIPPDRTRLVATVNVGTFDADTTIISHLLLARFVDPTLEWTYTTPYLATTRIKFQELPHEYPRPPQMTNPPPPLPEPAYLFIFNEVGIRTDRFTSYENTIQIPGGAYQGTYIPAPFSFDTVKVGLKLDQEKLEFKSFKFPGNPLNKMWPFALDGILTVEIVEVDALTPRSITAVTRFFGDVWSVDSSYKATAVPFGNLFDRKFPRFLLSVSDNYTQFSPPTMLTPSAFVVADGKISDPKIATGDHTSQTLIVNSAIGHAKEQFYFAGGWLETGSGATLEKRGILNSGPVGDALVRTLSGYSRAITIDHTLVPSAQTNFPVLVSTTNAAFKTVANGGKVQNSSGFDIGFYSDMAGTTKLKWEMERYNPATGEIVAWVKIPSLSSSTDTTFYMFYGDPAITTDQSDKVNVWTSNYTGVFHLADGTTLSRASSHNPAIVLNNNGVVTATSGWIDGAANFIATSSQSLEDGSGSFDTAAKTFSAWVNATTLPAAYNAVMGKGFGGIAIEFIYVRSNGKLRCQVNATTTISYDGTGTHTLITGTWYHVAYTYDSTSGLNAYVNGSLDASVAANGPMAATGVAMYLGGSRSIAGVYWNGKIDEAHYANVARSASWIATEYNNQNAPASFASVGLEGVAGAAPAAGDIKLTIDRPLLKARNLQPISLYPGYDGSIDQCETRFQNRINYGGHAYIPNVNPAVKAMKPQQTAGGKKGAGG